jgi:hypothetical protein
MDVLTLVFEAAATCASACGCGVVYMAFGRANARRVREAMTTA